MSAAAKAMDEMKRRADTDPELNFLGIKINRFGVIPNEQVGKILQDEYGYKHIEGSTQTPEGGFAIDEFLRV